MTKRRLVYIVSALLVAVIMLPSCDWWDSDNNTSPPPPPTFPPFNTSTLPLSVAGSGYGIGSFAFDANGDLLFTVSPSLGSTADIRKLDRQTGAETTVSTGVTQEPFLLGLAYENPIIYTSTQQGDIFSVDQGTGQATLLTNIVGEAVLCLAIAPATFGAYGGQLLAGTQTRNIYAIDHSAVPPTRTLIATISGVPSSMVFGSDGTLYVASWSVGGGKIVTVTEAGVEADFAIGVFSEPDGLAIDDAGGRLFVTNSGDDTLNQVTIPGGVVSLIANADFDSGNGSSPIIYDASSNILLLGTGESSLTIIEQIL